MGISGRAASRGTRERFLRSVIHPAARIAEYGASLLLEQILFLIVWHPRAVKSSGINKGNHDIEFHHVAGGAVCISVAIDAGIRPWIDQGVPVFQDCDFLSLNSRED